MGGDQPSDTGCQLVVGVEAGDVLADLGGQAPAALAVARLGVDRMAGVRAPLSSTRPSQSSQRHVTWSSPKREPGTDTHLLLSNKVRCLDGRWRAVDGRELYAHQKPAGNLYQAALRAELVARLGVEWEPVDING